LLYPARAVDAINGINHKAKVAFTEQVQNKSSLYPKNSSNCK
jgi:hypothetical protein